ncbi:OstA family protein [Terrimonas sp. NA20]|uniref:OstA family protein n=1 Tax=Terrimonas ginsenosidimutans TaxID=2908004 RepID=A0ABS9KWC4_9BACT|nr:OstA-like protein [Terrimonas ginsenosidimutans]MCG2616562.1 OstA family protein [Terrimonas ginsenosidimutans]
MNHTRIFLFFILLLACFGFQGMAQQNVHVPAGPPAAGDTTQKIEILNYTKRLTFQTLNDSTRLTIIAGDVKLRQGTTLFFCDSCVMNNNTNTFEAWGKGKQVHIDDDTTDIYSNHLLYYTQKKLAYLDGNVKLTDGKGTLTTPSLEYDMETNIGIYKNGGKVVNEKTVLTSKEGWYYADLRDIYFKKDVKLKDPAYDITTDSLLYNTESKTTRFISTTVIHDTTGKTIITKEGFYNQETKQAEFGRRPVIYDKNMTVRGDRITQNDSILTVEGNAIVVDTAQGQTIIGGVIYRNSKTQAILATRKPLMIIKQEKDSVFIAADTLFSARLTDKFGIDSIVVDTLKGLKAAAMDPKDSSNRYFEAYGNVRIFNDSLQAVGDSMFYSFKDSIFRLYKDPVVWAQENQVTGDTIYLYTENKKPKKVEAFENGFMVNRLDNEVYNQIKSTRIDGWFIDGNIDSLRAKGFAECIYYITDDDSAYTGINESHSDVIDIYFVQKELDKVVFRSSVNGTVWPIKQKSPSEMKLNNFRWLESRRPKSKFEMYE